MARSLVEIERNEMAKRVTKAQLLLQDARNRRDAAQAKLNDAWNAFKMAEAVAVAFNDAYYSLEASLAPKPRKKSEPGSTPAQTAEKKSKRRSAAPQSIQSTETNAESVTAASKPGTLPETCLKCGGDENATDHFAPSPNFHNYTSSDSKAA